MVDFQWCFLTCICAWDQNSHCTNAGILQVKNLWIFNSMWTLNSIYHIHLDEQCNAMNFRNIFYWKWVAGYSWKYHSYSKFTQWLDHGHLAVCIHLYRLLYFTLKTVSSENVSSCQLVKFHLHTASTLSIRNWECWTNGQEKPGELLPLFISAVDLSLEIYSTMIDLLLFDADWLHLGHIKALQLWHYRKSSCNVNKSKTSVLVAEWTGRIINYTATYKHDALKKGRKKNQSILFRKKAIDLHQIYAGKWPLKVLLHHFNKIKHNTFWTHSRCLHIPIQIKEHQWIHTFWKQFKSHDVKHFNIMNIVHKIFIQSVSILLGHHISSVQITLSWNI